MDRELHTLKRGPCVCNVHSSVTWAQGHPGPNSLVKILPLWPLLGQEEPGGT